MKVALYFEFHQFLGGIFFKNRATGLLSAFDNQKEYLTRAGIDHVEGLDPAADIWQFNAPWLRSRRAMRRGKKLGKKTVLFAHTTVEDSLGVFWFTKYVVKPYRWYLTNTFNLPDLMICPSHYTKRLLVERYGIASSKIEVVSNGVDTKKYKKNTADRLRVRQALPVGERLIVGCVGILVPRKGVADFIELARRHPEHLFVWVGRPMAKRFLKKYRRRAPANCFFVGYVPRVLPYLSAFDIFFFPSFEENQGIALLEAAAMGLPLLVRDLPVYRDWLVPQKNCLAARNIDQFSDQLQEVAGDKQLRDRLAAQALRAAGQNSLELMGVRIKKIYQGLLSGKY